MGYSSQKIRTHLKIKGIKAIIPFKSNEKASRDGRRKLDTGGIKIATSSSGALGC
ncbi:hypothetical protein ACTVKI_09935 [Serratia marcescens]|uniref:hypothetical protein n=1 Tax=Serratia TaxID=613 RepID=UPI0013F17968